jgi:hypothetical protein
LFRNYILLDPLVLILIIFGYIFSYLSSTYSNYVNLLHVLFSISHPNPLHVLIILVPLVMYFYQECWTIFCFMVFYAIIHVCHRWLWEVSCIVPQFLKVMTNNQSLTSSKTSSSMASSSEASYVSLIISALCVVLSSLIILWLWVIILWWCYALLCRIMQLFRLKLLFIILCLCYKLLCRIIFGPLHIVILWFLCRLSYYMFIMHLVCIYNHFFNHLQGSIVLFFVSN